MRMALCTADGESKPRGCSGANPVDHGEITKLQRINAAFLVDHGVAMKARGNDVVGCGIWQQVAGELPGSELIQRHTVVDCSNHPIAIHPDRAFAVFLIAIGIGVAGQIQPTPRPALAIARAGQQRIDKFFVGIHCRIG